MTAPPPGGPGDRAHRPRPRGNGLAAEHFVMLLDVDPRVAVQLLDALGRAGIAAYVAPTPGKVGGYLDVKLPERPTDRLWVDGRLRDQAGEIVRSELADLVDSPLPGVAAAGEPGAEPSGEQPAGSPDDPFEAIVAAFHEAWAPGADVPWPAAEDVPPSDLSTALPPSRVVRYSPAEVAQPAPDRELPGYVEDYLDEHFVPDPPPPIPRPAIATFWALVGLVGGLGVLLGAAILQWDLDPVVTGGAALGILGGFATLVWRLREPGDGDPPDDGAVV